MEKIILIVLILAITAFSFLFLTSKTTHYAEIIDMSNKTNYFKRGVYYFYNFSTNYKDYSKAIDVEPLFSELISNKIPLIEAWYKPYASSCCPPNSNFCMQALVQPALIVRLSYDDKKIEKFNFVKTENPNMGWCAYYVSHYIFK